MNVTSVQPTSNLRWYRTYDLDNVTTSELQQQWVITEYGIDSVPVRQTTEWRKLPWHDGGLRV